MKILIGAAACHPQRGSESFVAWSAIMALAEEHELWILTHGEARAGIEAVLPTLACADRLHFHYLCPPRKWHPNRLIARLQDWGNYHQWCREAREEALRLVGEIPFDLAHHITYASWRKASPLAGLGLPLVFGPVGGGETFPLRLLGILSPLAKVFEIARIVANAWARNSPRLRRFAHEITVALANNHETYAALSAIGVPASKIHFLSQSFLSPVRLALLQPKRPKSDPAKELLIFAGGNLEGRKGVALALSALVRLRAAGIPFRFRYGGQGPEYRHLCQLASQLGLDHEVSIGEVLTAEEYHQALQESHVYLLPSLREGAPVTMIEAMAAGCVPIVVACGGSAMLIDETCGFALPPADEETLVAGIARALVALVQDSTRLERMSASARAVIEARCTPTAYLEGISRAYAQALVGKSVKPKQ